jgi:hypothetical protein
MLSINKAKQILKEDGIELDDEQVKTYLETMQFLVRQTIDYYYKDKDDEERSFNVSCKQRRTS